MNIRYCLAAAFVGRTPRYGRSVSSSQVLPVVPISVPVSVPLSQF